MNTTIDHLLTNVYELEGLLLVMDRHKGEVPHIVISRFKEKAQEVAEVAKSLEFPTSTPPQEVVPASTPEPIPDSAPQTTVAPSAPTEEPKVVVTPPIPQPAKDITEAFTINDRFLFQRELFDGDKQQFDETIATLQRIGDFDKMKEHMTDVLGWDTSNEVVKEFIRLIDLSTND